MKMDLGVCDPGEPRERARKGGTPFWRPGRDCYRQTLALRVPWLAATPVTLNGLPPSPAVLLVPRLNGLPPSPALFLILPL